MALLVPALASGQVREKDKKCMDCHEKQGMYYNPAAHWGNLHSLTINYKKFRMSKHGVFLCVECHTDADAGEKTHFSKVGSSRCESCHINADLYTSETKKMFAEKGIEMKEAYRVFADYRESKHGKAYYAKKRNAPYCTGCHNPHNANVADSEYAAGRKNLPVTCGGCHAGQTAFSKNVIEKMAMSAINGHKKGDPSVDYSSSNCIDCHQGDAAHGKKLTGQKCMMCHKTGDSLLYSDFHGSNLPVLSLLLNFGLIFGAVVIGGMAVVYVVSNRGNKKEEHADEGHH